MTTVIINHENNNLLEYSYTTGPDISTSAAAGVMTGTNYGLNILIDDTVADSGTTVSFNTPNNVIRARFYLHLNALTQTNGTNMGLFEIVGAVSALLLVRYEPTAGTNYIGTRPFSDGEVPGTVRYCAIDNSVAHWIEVTLTRASDSGSSNGTMSWTLDGVAQTGSTGIDNYDSWGSSVFLRVGAGVYSGVPASTAGTIYIDEIEYNDTGALIGPMAGPSGSVSPSISPSASSSPSASQSPSASVSPSVSQSASVSPSISQSASVSPSISQSASVSPSVSPSISPSVSPSVSQSVSPSISGSASVSPSISGSASISKSASVSPSISQSASASPSLVESSSVSPSPSPGITASVCWGHDTGVIEANIRNFQNNWTGTGAIGNPGVADTERLELEAGEYMISEIVETGTLTMEIDYNHYAAGDTINLDYRHGATPAACVAAAWNDYTVPFMSLGYVQIRVTSTL